jgi:hypothetical protein
MAEVGGSNPPISTKVYILREVIVMAGEKRGADKAGLGGFVFVGCLIIGLGVGIGFDFMPAALIIGLGAGFIAMGIVRYKTGKW